MELLSVWIKSRMSFFLNSQESLGILISWGTFKAFSNLSDVTRTWELRELESHPGLSDFVLYWAASFTCEFWSVPQRIISHACSFSPGKNIPVSHKWSSQPRTVFAQWHREEPPTLNCGQSSRRSQTEHIHGPLDADAPRHTCGAVEWDWLTPKAGDAYREGVLWDVVGRQVIWAQPGAYYSNVSPAQFSGTPGRNPGCRAAKYEPKRTASLSLQGTDNTTALAAKSFATTSPGAIPTTVGPHQGHQQQWPGCLWLPAVEMLRLTFGASRGFITASKSRNRRKGQALKGKREKMQYPHPLKGQREFPGDGDRNSLLCHSFSECIRTRVARFSK